MWIHNEIFRRDLEEVTADPAIPWNKLAGHTVLVTGATGLIGSTMVSALLYYGFKNKVSIKVLALVRNEEKARKLFQEQRIDCGENLKFVIGDVCALPEISESIDYIIHGASQTASKAFIENPVETIDIAITGTKNMLELAREKKCRSFVYLSSMEVYGYPEKGHKVTEYQIGALTPLKPRNCYPLSKQLCESICCAYTSEYHVPVRIVRLTQTFGPGVNYHDGRVFAEFARCVINKSDIVLKTAGETERSYVYTMDAVGAILTVLLKGNEGEAYNIANESSYCSIAQMADLVSNLGGVKVIFDLQDFETLGYAQTLFMDLDTTKIRSLGWIPRVGLINMYRNMIACMI